MEKLIGDFSIGLFFMQAVILVILILLARKFAWKPILEGLSQREEGIQNAIEAAAKAEAKMKELTAQNDVMMQEARAERDAMLKDAKSTANAMVEDAKNKASQEAEKVLASARETIAGEKNAAIAELKTQVAAISLEIAEKVVRGELASDEKQKALASKMAEDISLN